MPATLVGKVEDFRKTQVPDPEADPQDSKKCDTIRIRQRNMKPVILLF